MKLSFSGLLSVSLTFLPMTTAARRLHSRVLPLRSLQTLPLTLRGGAGLSLDSTQGIAAGKRSKSTESNSNIVETTPAILFDIDGVFKQGGLWEKDGLSALRRVIEAKVPFAFMTNGGGGKTEQEYAKDIFKKLFKACNSDGNEENLDMSPNCIKAEHMILSYSPWDCELAHLKDKSVLIVGDPASKVMNVVKEYGFKKAIHIEDYSQAHPLLNPFQRYVNEAYDTKTEKWDEKIEAILVFTDPQDYFEGIQICTDLLLSSRPGEVEVEEGHDIPIYFSNPDLLWKAQHNFARFGQGAFKLCLKALFEARLTAHGLEDRIEQGEKRWIQFGKPTVVQYQSALKALLNQDPTRKISHVYMVGDNTQSDIQGTVNMNIYNDIPHPANLEEMKTVQKQKASSSSSSSTFDSNSSINEMTAVESACSKNDGLPNDQVWGGVLVRTGVFKDGDDKNGAVVVCDDVSGAVDAILNNHGLLR